MKKTTINVGFDEEKTAAARLYMKQKNLKKVKIYQKSNNLYLLP